jgi:hypothetical protein
MQRRGSLAGVGRYGAVAGEMAVEVAGQAAGGGVVDGPQGTDDVLVASEMERTSYVSARTASAGYYRDW